MLKPSLSVLVFALNEAGNLKNTINAILQAKSGQKFAGFDILIVDDGSTDATGIIAEHLAQKNDFIRVVHNSKPKGIGDNFRTFAPKASGDYVGWFPGDNETLLETIQEIFAKIGEKDIVIPYTFNPWVRPLFRRLLSSTYTTIFNILFGMNLKYFNGTCFFRKELLKTVTMSTNGLAYMAEILIQLLKQGNATYIEVPMYIRAREFGTSKVLKWKNVWLIGKTITSLFWRIHFKRKNKIKNTSLI